MTKGQILARVRILVRVSEFQRHNIRLPIAELALDLESSGLLLKILGALGGYKGSEIGRVEEARSYHRFLYTCLSLVSPFLLDIRMIAHPAQYLNNELGRVVFSILCPTANEMLVDMISLATSRKAL